MFFLPLCFSVPFLFAQGERIPISMPAARNLALVSVDGEPSASLRISHHAVSLPGGQRLLFPGDSSLWTVVDFDGDGAGELLVLANGESLLRLCGRAQSATVPCSWGSVPGAGFLGATGQLLFCGIWTRMVSWT